MVDQLSERYGDLLSGSYDCVDRVVLNAYFPLGHSPGGIRTWWRRWHGGSDDDLDNAHLMRLAGRFARRVRAWGHAHGVELLDGAAAATYAAGFALATTLLHALGLGIAYLCRSYSGKLLVRGTGAAVVVAGVALAIV